MSNLICKIHLQEISGNLIIDESDNSYGSLIGHIPQLIGMRILSPEQIHGYALQFKYADDSTRNYYLHCFDTREIPEVCNISGYKFTNDDFMSAALDDAGNVTFRNGYRVPRHVLFYRSTRQVDIEHTDIDLYKGDEIIIHSLYRLPVEEESRRWKKIPWYRGRPDENYGTAEAFLDDNGVRVSDISVYSKEKKEGIMGAYLVCVEPTGKYGYLNGDGTWFAPPIYDRAEIFTDKCAMVARAGKNFLLISDSTEKQFDFPIDLVQFTNNRYLFKAEEWKGEEPDAGHYYDYSDVSPGKWGVMDSDCRVIVEPKYVFAVACWDMELNLKEYSIVARFVDEKLRWGVIDVDGIEVIPCIFSELYSCWGNSIVFQTKEQGPYGLMDFNGNIIVEPMFGYIDDYNVEHRLITAGDYEDDLGVYSIDLGKMIISGDFDCIDYGEHMISCEPFGSSSWKRYFDYSGKEIFFEGYDCVFELSGGLLCAYKDRKSGLIDLEGNVILPPISGGMSVLTNYNKGYVVTGIDNRKGLSRVSGEVILPEIYSDIRFYGDILVASERIEGNRCIRDTLFTLDGRPLLKGPYRHINIDEKSNTLSFESPLGHEYCKIIRNDV